MYHPGYEVYREIFRFVAHNKSKDGKGWIDYDFAYGTCMAMANCVEIGIFTLGRAPNLPKVERQFGALMEGKKYYFHLGNEEAEVAEQYAVIRSVRDYTFSASQVALASSRALHWQRRGIYTRSMHLERIRWSC